MPATHTEWAQGYLASGSTALALALRIERPDGTVHAFTNIRRSSTLPDFTVRGITIPSTTYDARAAFTPTNLVMSERPDKTDNWEASFITGVWLPKIDIRKKKLANAPYTLVVFDWRTNTPIRFLVRGEVGLHKFDGDKVTFKMRSLSQILQQEILEVTNRRSRAQSWDAPELAFFTLGDNTADGYASQVAGTIDSVDSDEPRRQFVFEATGDFPSGRFKRGVVTFTSGDNDGFSAGVLIFDSGAFLLDRKTPVEMETGDSIVATIAPPLTFEEWMAYFGDGMYFPGEPQIPTQETASEVTSS